MDVTITGGEIEIDRVVLESIRDPLNHLLRNAIDHGIETPELRRKANKSEEGKVTLSTSSEGRQIFICLEDDGQGVLVEKVKSIALRKNLYTRAELQVLSREDILDIIFHPGFSTPIAVVQHMSQGFLLGMVEWLQKTTPLKLKLAEDGEILQNDTVYFAPENRHLVLKRTAGELATSLASDPPVGQFRPSATTLFQSAASNVAIAQPFFDTDTYQ